MSKIPTFSGLETAAQDEALTWLEENGPQYAAGVRQAIASGATPEQVYLQMLRLVGQHREPLAWRCKLAAAALVEQVEAG